MAGDPNLTQIHIDADKQFGSKLQGTKNCAINEFGSNPLVKVDELVNLITAARFQINENVDVSKK